MAGGGKEIVTGFTYSGGMAQVVCMGLVKTLHSISNGDTVIFEGPINFTDADGDGKAAITTTIGDGNFYFGSTTQNLSTILQQIKVQGESGLYTVNHPGLRGVAYFESLQLEFGTQTTPPTLIFEVTVEPSSLVGAANHLISEDALLPEIIYDYFTNKLWGIGQDPALINAATFVALQDSEYARGVGLAPIFDDKQTLRQWTGKLFHYGDIFPRFKNGLVELCQLGVTAETGDLIDEGELLDVPRPRTGGLDSTWSYTRIKFTNRDNNYEEGEEDYLDGGNSAIRGRVVPEDIDMPFCMRSTVAKTFAVEKGLRASRVTQDVEIVVKPSWRNKVPGDIVRFAYSKGNLNYPERRYWITEINRGNTRKPQVEMTLTLYVSRDTSKDYKPPNPIENVGAIADPDGSNTFEAVPTEVRALYLPLELRTRAVGPTNTLEDGYGVFCPRPSAMTNRIDVYLRPGGTFATYKREISQYGYPVFARVIGFHMLDTEKFLFRIQVMKSFDRPWMEVAASDGQDYLLISGKREVVTGTKDEHQIDGLWSYREQQGIFTETFTGIYDIEIGPEAFGSDPLRLETAAAEGYIPTHIVFFGRRDSFPYRHRQPGTWSQPGSLGRYDNGERYLKVVTATVQKTLALADADEFVYDRHDTTMEARGTYDRQWGPRALTTYELYDIVAPIVIEDDSVAFLDKTWTADIDEALGAIFDGFPTDTQSLYADNIDEVLGFVVETGIPYYNNRL